MNLLAHAVLSPPNRQIRIGNISADFVHRNERSGLAADLQAGIERHIAIDSFTDSHPIVSQSKARLIGFQRFGNPLVDVFYDHFLVRLEIEDDANFIDSIYRDLVAEMNNLPPNAQSILTRMIEDDWLSSYGSFEGLERALNRMERRIEWATGREVNMIDSIEILKSNYRDFENDFQTFWPEAINKFASTTPNSK